MGIKRRRYRSRQSSRSITWQDEHNHFNEVFQRLGPIPPGDKEWSQEQKEQDRVDECNEMSGLELNHQGTK